MEGFSGVSFVTSCQKVRLGRRHALSTFLLLLTTICSLIIPFSCLNTVAVDTSTREVTSAPTDLRLVSITSSTAELEWKEPIHPSTTSIVAYVINYKPRDSPKSELQVVSNTTRVTLDRLSALRKYLVTVSAFTNKAPGNSSPPFEFETKEDVPSGIPSLVLKPVSPTVLRIQWRKPHLDTTRGQIVKYEIQFRIHSLRTSSPNFRVQDMVPSEKSDHFLEVDLDNLMPGGKYDVRVVPATAAGLPTDESILKWSMIEMPLPLASLNETQPDFNSSTSNHHDITQSQNPLNSNRVPESNEDDSASRDLMFVQNLLLWILASAAFLFVLILIVVCVAYRRRCVLDTIPFSHG